MILFEPCVCAERSFALGASIGGVAIMIIAHYLMGVSVGSLFPGVTVLV